MIVGAKAGLGPRCGTGFRLVQLVVVVAVAAAFCFRIRTRRATKERRRVVSKWLPLSFLDVSLATDPLRGPGGEVSIGKTSSLREDAEPASPSSSPHYDLHRRVRHGRLCLRQPTIDTVHALYNADRDGAGCRRRITAHLREDVCTFEVRIGMSLGWYGPIHAMRCDIVYATRSAAAASSSW